MQDLPPSLTPSPRPDPKPDPKPKPVLIGAGLAMLHNVPCPVIRIEMTRGIGIPFEFSTDARGMPAQRLGNVLGRPAFSPSLPDIKAFFIP